MSFNNLFFFYFIPSTIAVFSSLFLMKVSFTEIFNEKVSLVLFFFISFVGIIFSDFFSIFCHSNWIRFFFITFFFINIFTDLYEKSIYDLISILFLVTVMFAFFLGSIIHISFMESILCGICFRVIFYLIFFVFRHFKKYEGIGMGDVDIVSCFSFFGGFLWTIWSIFLGCIIGIILFVCFYFFDKDKCSNFQIPFAPLFFLGVSMSYFLIFNLSILNFVFV
jgi:prepilin signal peptidase PulO-like enzyme (type II secretory pathway)